MYFRKSAFLLAIGTIGIATSIAAHAVTIGYGNQLTITAGVNEYDANNNFTNISSGSWFAMDINGNDKISGTEKTALSMGTTGIIIGATTSAGASHTGIPTGGDTNAITAPWSFFNNTGSDYTTVGITGSTEFGLNMSGWKSAYAGSTTFSLGSGAWGTGFSDGVGNFTLSETSGFYTLDYHATVPFGEPLGFGGTKYALHLEGYCTTLEGCYIYPTSTPTPEATTYAMMLAGLGIVGIVARRRRQAEVSVR